MEPNKLSVNVDIFNLLSRRTDGSRGGLYYYVIFLYAFWVWVAPILVGGAMAGSGAISRYSRCTDFFDLITGNCRCTCDVTVIVSSKVVIDSIILSVQRSTVGHRNRRKLQFQ